MTPDPLAALLREQSIGIAAMVAPRDSDTYWTELAARLRAAGVTTQAEALAAVRTAVEGLPEVALGRGRYVYRDDVLAAIDKVADTP